MFDYPLEPSLLHLLSAIIRFITKILAETRDADSGDPDETEVEPNP